METERYVVCQCSYSEIQGLIETKHYLKRRPQVTDSFALYDRDELESEFTELSYD